MMNSKKCQFLGHTESDVEYICLLKQCNKKERRICRKCLLEEKHKHNQANNHHIQEIPNFFENQQRQFNKFQPLIQQYKETLLKLFSTFYEEVSNAFQPLIGEQSLEDYIKIDNFELNEIIEQYNQGINLNRLYFTLEDFISQLKTFISNLRIKESYEISLKNVYYLNKDSQIKIAQISQDGQYLLHQTNNSQYEILDMNNQFQKETLIESALTISACIFSDNHFFYCDNDGYVYGLNIRQEQKKFVGFYFNKIHQNRINDILIQENNIIITCSMDQSIKITDFIKRQQIVSILLENKINIYSVDCDKSNNLITSCQSDQSIRCFNVDNSGKLILDQRYAHKGKIIQNILSLCDEGRLKIWEVNKQKTSIQKSQSLMDDVQIKSFSFVSNYLVLISVHQILIFDKYYNQIKNTLHDIQEFDTQIVHQMTKLQYLIAKGKSIKLKLQRQILSVQSRKDKAQDTRSQSTTISMKLNYNFYLFLNKFFFFLFNFITKTQRSRIKKQLFGSRTYGTEIDIWAFGCIYAELLQGLPLFTGKGEIDQIIQIGNLLGSPTEKNWPKIKSMPDFGKINFKITEPKDLHQYFDMSDNEQIEFLNSVLLYQDRPTAEFKINYSKFYSSKGTNYSKLQILIIYFIFFYNCYFVLRINNLNYCKENNGKLSKFRNQINTKLNFLNSKQHKVSQCLTCLKIILYTYHLWNVLNIQINGLSNKRSHKKVSINQSNSMMKNQKKLIWQGI
ncbi:hypothetical protein pb186bvf_015190 [Paramecium bursaria]